MHMRAAVPANLLGPIFVSNDPVAFSVVSGLVSISMEFPLRIRFQIDHVISAFFTVSLFA